MRISLAGVPFLIGPADRLGAGERSACEGILRSGMAWPGFVEPFRIDLASRPPWPGGDPAAYPDRAPARITARDGRLRVVHRRFLAELDTHAARGTLYRTQTDGMALTMTLRVALAARLPLLGGLPLHAAGVSLSGQGVAFIGPSGAGKTSLAETSLEPVLSDEFVVAGGVPWQLAPSGFWGAGPSVGDASSAPLVAVMALDKGGPAHARVLTPRVALRRLLDALLVPPEPRLWDRALEVAGRLVREVPFHSLCWSLHEPPWNVVRRAIAGGECSGPASSAVARELQV